MCRVLNVHRSGFYAWLKKLISDRGQEDKRLLGQRKQFWMESGFAYGYRNITKDLKDHGESCGKNPMEVQLLKDYADEWLEIVKQTRRSSTHCRYEVVLRKHILPVLGGRRLDLIKRSEIRKLMLDLQKNNHSGSNIRLCRDVLRDIYGAAIDEEIVNGNPVKDILKRLGIAKKSSNEVEPFTGVEIYHLLNTSKSDFGTYHLFFMTACRTGMRLGE